MSDEADTFDPEATELPEDYDETGSRYSPEELFGAETVEQYGAIRELSSEEAADNLQNLQERYEQLAEDAYEETMAAETIREQLGELAEGDVDYDSWMAAVRHKASGLPILGDKLKDLGDKPTLVKQLEMRYNSLQRNHAAMGAFAEEVAEYKDKQEAKRKDIVRAKRDKMNELREAEEALAGLRSRYEEVEETVENAAPGEQVDISGLPVDKSDLGVSSEDAVYTEDLEVYFYDLEDELNEVQDEKTRLDYAVDRLVTKQQIADIMVEAADHTATNVEESYNSLAENLDVYDMAIQGETKIGKAVEQTTSTGLLLQNTKELNSKAIEAYAEGVREISRARVALFEDAPITEEAMSSVEDIMDEVEQIEEQHAVRADAKSRKSRKDSSGR